MSPELNRSDDRGEELATTEQAAQPAAVREPGHSRPADKTGEPANDTGQPADDETAGIHESAHGIDETAAEAEAEDTGLTSRHRNQVTEPAADQTDGVLADAARLHAGWQRI